MSARPAQIAAEIDHDNGTFTVAITFRAGAHYSVDKCETGHFLGSLRRELTRWLTEPNNFGDPGSDTERWIEGFVMSCWDPCEEIDLGYMADYEHARCAGCGAPVRQRGLSHPRSWEWEHVDPIPVGDDGWPVCHHLAHQADDDAAIVACQRPHAPGLDVLVTFPNRLVVDLSKEQQ
jgi:hypothetical protein